MRSDGAISVRRGSMSTNQPISIACDRNPSFRHTLPRSCSGLLQMLQDIVLMRSNLLTDRIPVGRSGGEPQDTSQDRARACWKRCACARQTPRCLYSSGEPGSASINSLEHLDRFQRLLALEVHRPEGYSASEAESGASMTGFKTLGSAEISVR